MQEVYDFLKKAGIYYLATIDNDQPRIRPFGTVNVFEGKLYIQTGKVKPVSKQMMANPKIEICAMSEGKWIRIEATVVEDDRLEPKEKMLDSYPSLKDRYSSTDNNTQVLFLKDATATIESFGAASRVIKF
ncbi:MAG: NimC/NimA family protein [Clostridiales bacterium]|nr:NimC/NimA family protein [Clostridiales bacterium]